MYKRTIADKARKRILSVVLAAVMVVPLLTGVTAKDMSKVEAAAALHNPSKGSNGVVTWDCVYFGRYPQSDATGKTSEAIKWRVLSVNGNDAFLMADCNLDVQKYNERFVEITWEQCTMRSWLNGYGSSSNIYGEDYGNDNFIERAFMTAERKAILTTTVKTGNNTYCLLPGDKYSNTPGGNDTQDKIFLMSYEDMTNPVYGFQSDAKAEDAARTRKNTAFVAAGGSYQLDVKFQTAAGENAFWSLRSPGDYARNNMSVNASGRIATQGVYVFDTSTAVCPALHLNLSETNIWSYAGTVSSDGSSTPGEAPPTVGIQAKDPNTGATYVEKEETGSGKTVEYQQSPGGSSANVVVPDTVKINGTTYTVTSVSNNAFKNNKKIKSIVIGNNVKTIGENAFMGCSNLESVTIGKNVTNIKAKAFYKCKKLKSITIPSKVNKIGKQAFYGCKNLKTINIKTIKLTNKNVGSKAFKGIHSKATIKVPKKKLSAYKKLLKAKGVGSKATIKK